MLKEIENNHQVHILKINIVVDSEGTKYIHHQFPCALDLLIFY